MLICIAPCHLNLYNFQIKNFSTTSDVCGAENSIYRIAWSSSEEDVGSKSKSRKAAPFTSNSSVLEGDFERRAILYSYCDHSNLCNMFLLSLKYK